MKNEKIEFLQNKFYTENLIKGLKIENKAINNMLCYSLEDLQKITNYDEAGIVEFVANNNFKIVNNKIEPEDL